MIFFLFGTRMLSRGQPFYFSSWYEEYISSKKVWSRHKQEWSYGFMFFFFTLFYGEARLAAFGLYLFIKNEINE